MKIQSNLFVFIVIQIVECAGKSVWWKILAILWFVDGCAITFNGRKYDEKVTVFNKFWGLFRSELLNFQNFYKVLKKF